MTVDLLLNTMIGEGNGTHSSTPAWKIPWTEEPGGLQSMGSLSRTWLSNFSFTFLLHALEKEMATHSSILAWRIPGTAEPAGLPSMGSHRVRHDWSDLAAAAAATTVLFRKTERIQKWRTYSYHKRNFQVVGGELGKEKWQPDSKKRIGGLYVPLTTLRMGERGSICCSVPYPPTQFLLFLLSWLPSPPS